MDGNDWLWLFLCLWLVFSLITGRGCIMDLAQDCNCEEQIQETTKEENSTDKKFKEYSEF